MKGYIEQMNDEYEKCIVEMAEKHGFTKKNLFELLKEGKCTATRSNYNKKDGTGVVKKEHYIVNGVDIGTIVTETEYPKLETKHRYTNFKIKITIE